MKTNKIKCECPGTSFVRSLFMGMYSEEEKSGMNHSPNECEGTNEIKAYKRNNKILYLCSCCNLYEDKELD